MKKVNVFKRYSTSTTNRFQEQKKEFSPLISKSIEYLLGQDVEGVEGIFRKSGSDKLIQNFKKKVEITNKINLYKEKELTKNVHNITGLIITTLQEISDPITTYALYDDFLSTIEIKEEKQKIETLKKILFEKLPETNRECFVELLSLLYVIKENSTKNLMNTDNLAIVFTPVVFRNENSLRNPKIFMEELPKCQKVMISLIDYYPDLVSSKDRNDDSKVEISIDTVKQKRKGSNVEEDDIKNRYSLDPDSLASEDISSFLPKKVVLYSTRKPPKTPIKRLDRIRGRGKSLPVNPKPELLIKKKNRCANCHLVIQEENDFKKIEDQLYHIDCFNCTTCNEKILQSEEVNFSKNRITCQKCGPYESDELDLGICVICKAVCSLDDSILILKKFYHIKECFRCHLCEKELSESFQTFNNFPICDECFIGKIE
eukprot:gene11744-5082_t